MKELIKSYAQTERNKIYIKMTTLELNRQRICKEIEKLKKQLKETYEVEGRMIKDLDKNLKI